MERETGKYENGYFSKRDKLNEIEYCKENLKPYYKKLKPLDRFYRRCKISLTLMYDSLCYDCDDKLKSDKKKDKKKRNKIKKDKKRYVKKLSKYEKSFLKLEGRKSFDKEIAETMQLINKGIAKSQP
jgi:hypothetical protein